MLYLENARHRDGGMACLKNTGDKVQLVMIGMSRYARSEGQKGGSKHGIHSAGKSTDNAEESKVVKKNIM